MARLTASLQHNGGGKNRRHRDHRSKKNRKPNDYATIKFKHRWRSKDKRKKDRHVKQMLRSVVRGKRIRLQSDKDIIM